MIKLEASKDMCWLSVQFQGHKTDYVLLIFSKK